MKTASSGRSSTRGSRSAEETFALPPQENVVTAGEATELGRTYGDESQEMTPVRQRIAERAYLLYLARDDQDGDALGDWLEAERQVTAEAAALLE